MAEVMAAHWSRSTHSDSEPFVDKCDGCGAVIYTWGTDADVLECLATHQAAELIKAGYGNMADAWDEGHGIGCVDQILTVANGEQYDTPNPYRGAGHE
jgi:hypothetical protein